MHDNFVSILKMKEVDSGNYRLMIFMLISWGGLVNRSGNHFYKTPLIKPIFW